MPGINWTRIRADNEIRPTVGSKLALEVRGAHDAIVSDTTFVQAIAHGKWIWSLPRGQRILVRGQLGATAEREFEELPASVRFFAGGDNSVRGYAFEELGPVDADGNVIGGSSLATGSFEFEQPLRARWSLAFFVDSGNAFEGSRHRREDERRPRRPLAVAARARSASISRCRSTTTTTTGACTSRLGPDL